ATRLAIRGLGSGRQPIADPASGILCVCNGEIDNHREIRSWLAARGRPVEQQTDVAVLPGLYLEEGERFVERLVGAFALALWDPRRGRLLLARDRTGERPLFYHCEGRLIRFATEIAALAAEKRLSLSPDPRALASYLRFGSFTAPRTPFREIRKVSPAEILVFDEKGERRRRYWRWRIASAPKRAATIDTLDSVFREAIRRQRDAEVDSGVFLSGGIDSSLVAAVARSVYPEQTLRAYTLRFSEASYDEGIFAGKVARRLGLPSAEVWIEARDFPAGITELVRRSGEPLADPAWVPTALLARRASEDVKLALVGEGGDELFGGYPTYIGALLAERFASAPGWTKRIGRTLIGRLPPSDKKVTLSFLLKRFAAGAEMEGVERHLLWTSNVPPPLLARLGLDPALAAPEAIPREGELLDVVQQIDLETSLAEGLLTKADRASMNSAIELRAPFLDLGMLELAATLPASDRVQGFQTKRLLRRYAARYLDRGTIHRRKRGLSVPLAAWLRAPLHDWAASRLCLLYTSP
ncbi:MAG: asparagine synthase (glutamine-hydrolyzing), partial [Candidatus Eisenbacteria bacterium]|nr:asparagine synthase (glutamine-hydrolyzing) [Candidatus Eisenbacteria bacterium]